MCRIAGFWDFRDSDVSYHPENTINAMQAVLAHGGPDDSGTAIFHLTNPKQSLLAFGHRRLSIIDTSKAGHQPMSWQHLTIIFNGELYNYAQIKHELQNQYGRQFTTQTDTEVLLQAWHQWGSDCLNKFNGMFAFALFDQQTQNLTLVRDRFGVKPLYWYQKNGLLLFASELKAFHKHPHFEPSLNAQAISLYLQQGYIQAPHCIYEESQKLPGGTLLQITAQGQITQQTWYSAAQVYANPIELPTTEPELITHLEKLLHQSFALRMVADVPIGVFLSGGIDSTTVAALLQQQFSQPLQTCTIGFDQPDLNEARHAKQIANYLKTQHTELYCTEADCRNLLPLLPTIFDEPFGDSSAIPTYLVAQLAKQQVKVSLSADGGDELFGGYTKYQATLSGFNQWQKLPAKQLLSKTIQLFNPDFLAKMLSLLPAIQKNHTNLSNKLYKLQRAVQANTISDFFAAASVYLSPKEQQLIYPVFCPRWQPDFQPQNNRIVGYLGLTDLLTYLEGDILTKVDRATMHNALEGREPFLDHRLVNFALSLPDAYKIKNGQTKYLLRQVLYKYVPKQLIDRPKQGFAIPITQWLHTILRQPLQALTHDQTFFADTQLQQPTVSRLINQFLNKKQYVNPHIIWFIYTFWVWWHQYKK